MEVVCKPRAHGITVESTMRKMKMKQTEKARLGRRDFLYNTAALTLSSLPSCGAHVVSDRTRCCHANMPVRCIVRQSWLTKITFLQT